VTGRQCGAEPEPIRVVRVIARLNVGGPAIQAITLTRELEPLGYKTVLVRGREAPDEGSMDDLAGRLRIQPRLVTSLRRDPGLHDFAALWSLARLIRRERPHIVHTHAAKGGTLGRVAALLASAGRRQRPVLVHTFHGHSLTGYFSPRTAAVYRFIEQVLAFRTDRLIAVSDHVRDELVALRVAPPSRFDVIPLGFDLSRFAATSTERENMRIAARAELGLGPNAKVVTLIARLVPIKRVDRFLRSAAVVSQRSDAYFLIVGDGELREQLRNSPDAQALADRLVWTGFRTDMPAICAASDVIVQSSDNEGTPVSLIEAQASGVPVVSTRVGGTASVVVDGVTGILVSAEDVDAFATAVVRLLRDLELSGRMGVAGRERALSMFSLTRLVANIDALYRGLLAARPSGQR
jgi:glycosyltransferase involved in cell wall biosynthesis